jgi:hypothetical protein
MVVGDAASLVPAGSVQTGIDLRARRVGHPPNPGGDRPRNRRGRAPDAWAASPSLVPGGPVPDDTLRPASHRPRPSAGRAACCDRPIHRRRHTRPSTGKGARTPSPRRPWPRRASQVRHRGGAGPEPLAAHQARMQGGPPPASRMQNAPIGAGAHGDWSGADIQSERRYLRTHPQIRVGH